MHKKCTVLYIFYGQRCRIRITRKQFVLNVEFVYKYSKITKNKIAIWFTLFQYIPYGSTNLYLKCIESIYFKWAVIFPLIFYMNNHKKSCTFISSWRQLDTLTLVSVNCCLIYIANVLLNVRFFTTFCDCNFCAKPLAFFVFLFLNLNVGENFSYKLYNIHCQCILIK